jgi:hypothetical protein
MDIEIFLDRGSDRAVDNASDFHLNVPRFKFRFGYSNFSSNISSFLELWHYQDLYLVKALSENN